MKTASLPANAPEKRMRCMEVWGGHGPTNHHFARPGLDIWIWSRAQRSTEAGGGDLHLLSSCASGRISRMLLADVCGYDSLFPEIASELRELMVQNVNSIRQAQIVRGMCRRLEKASHRGGYASTLISTYFAPKRSLTICNAGHPPPLLFRAQTREWSVQRQAPNVAASRKTAPGVVDQNEYQQFKITLEIGDMVLGFSNVLTECRSAAATALDSMVCSAAYGNLIGNNHRMLPPDWWLAFKVNTKIIWPRTT